MGESSSCNGARFPTFNMAWLAILFNAFSKMQSAKTEEKSNPYLMWQPFAFKTASVLPLSSSFWRKSAGRLLQTSWRTNHRSSLHAGCLKSFCLFMFRALWGPYHYFQDSSFLFSFEPWRLFPVILPVCLLLNIIWGHSDAFLMVLHDGMHICLYCSALRTSLILTKSSTPFSEMHAPH